MKDYWIIVTCFLALTVLFAGYIIDSTPGPVDTSFIRGYSISCVNESCPCTIEEKEVHHKSNNRFLLTCPRSIYGTALFTFLVMVLAITGAVVGLCSRIDLDHFLLAVPILAIVWFVFWELIIASFQIPVIFGDPWEGDLFVYQHALPWEVYRFPFNIFISMVFITMATASGAMAGLIFFATARGIKNLGSR